VDRRRHQRLRSAATALHTSVGRWLHRRFTLAGRLAVIALLVSGLAGADTNRSMAYQLFALIAALLLLAWLQSLSFHPNIRVNRLLPRFATAGEPFMYRLHVSNQDRRVLPEGMVVDEATIFSGTIRKEIPGTTKQRSLGIPKERLPALTPGTGHEVALTVRPPGRGLIQWSSVTFGRPDPSFSLVNALHQLALPQSLVVLPKRYPIPRLTLPGNRKYQEAGMQLVTAVGESQEFLSLRDYRLGDPLRSIHWKSWAHLGRPLVKENQEEFLARHALILDTCEPIDSPSVFEEAISVAASFSCGLETQDSVVDLLFVGQEAYCVTAGRGLGQVEQLLEVLACVRPSPPESFAQLHAHVMQRAGMINGAICVLVAWNEMRQRFIQALLSLGLPILVLVIVENGESLIQELGNPASHPEWLHVLTVGEIGPQLAAL
jgi:uncharacterized protein (DUF58 family)